MFQIVEKGLSGKPFTHQGRFWNIERPIRLRPEPVDKPVRFYGAIGSPASAEVMGELGIAPICLSTFPDGLLAKILERWRRVPAPRRSGAILPISVKMFIADTDEEAREMGRRYYPAYFALQAATTRPTPTRGRTSPSTPTSAACSPTCASCQPRRARAVPRLDLVGSAETICKRIDPLAALGFNYFMVSSATPGTPLGCASR